MNTKSKLILAALTLSALPFTGFAQEPPPPAGPPAVDGGPANADRVAQFRQRMLERLKTTLKASDEEMTVIQPLIEKVNEKQREAGGGRWGGPGGPGGPRGPRGGDRPPGENGGAPQDGPRRERGPRGGGGSPESQALQAALENDNTPASEIQTKLAALREQRKKSAAELASAREDLRKVLTARQEATLVQIGLLE